MELPGTSGNQADEARIVLLDKFTSVRQLVAAVLSQSRRFSIVGEAGTIEAGQQIFSHIIPDIVIMDILPPDISGLAFLKHLRMNFKQLKILLFSCSHDPTHITSELHEMPQGFVSKYDSLTTLLTAIDTVSRGGLFWSSSPVVSQIAQSPAACAPPLSERERSVLAMVANGLSSKEIAEKFAVSPKSVDNTRSQIMRKLGLRNASALTRYAIQNGMPTGVLALSSLSPTTPESS